ncbi:MAG: tRNA (adenosine(37)-N6)-dimethylallyltransferase MiaA [Candidatus Saccharibacteria bacterium]|nr:tRNA (adenosine(37)-N6)-dimethylallyltransferase MiaA [Candidatus Saccharibacteria bacterium]
MNSRSSLKNSKIIVICGPTGSGKTGASIELALRIGGEVISADSRAIYKGMDIGTAKPTLAEMKGVPHWGIDLVEPGERFTVADFKEYAEQKILEIQARGKVPIIAGGTGLYVDALVYGYQFGKEDIEQKSYSKITGVDDDFARKYPDRVALREEFLMYGIKWETEELRERLRKRLSIMYCDELYAETRKLVEQYGWGSQAMKSDIYEYAWKYLNGELSLDEAIEQNFYRDWHLAKRQMTWFKRTPQIKWVRLDKIVDEIEQNISKIE